MKIRWRIWHILLLTAVIALFLAANLHVTSQARRYCSKIIEQDEKIIAALMSDAGVEGRRHFLGRLPVDLPAAKVARPGLFDYLLARRYCNVEFITEERQRNSFISYAHQHRYSFYLFSWYLDDASESWRWTIT